MSLNKEELKESFIKNFNFGESQEETQDLIYEDKEFEIPIGIKNNFQKVWELFLNCIPQITTLLTVGYFLMTNMIVLRLLGKDELIASYGIGQTWANLIMVSPIISIGIGLLSPASQAYGCKNFKRFGVILNQGYLFTFGIFLFSFFIFVLNTPFFLTSLGVQASIAKEAQVYLLSSMPAYIFQILFDVKRFWLFSQQKADIPKYASLIGMAFNPLWLYIFVYYLDLELVGIGLTRLCTFSILFFLQEYLIKRNEPQVVELVRRFSFVECWQEDFGQFAKVVASVGLIGIIPWLNQECSTVVVANLHNVPEIAAHTTLLAVTPLTHFFMTGCGQSLSGFFGNAAGQGNIPKIRYFYDQGFKLIGLVYLLISLPMLIFKDFFMDLFCTESVKPYFEPIYIIFYLIYFLLFGYEKFFTSILNTLDRQYQALNWYFVVNVLLLVPIEIIFCFTLGYRVQGVWVVIVLNSVAINVIFYFLTSRLLFRGEVLVNTLRGIRKRFLINKFKKSDPRMSIYSILSQNENI